MKRHVGSSVLILVILLAVGFATVTTNLLLNGQSNISTNPADFDIYFTEASTDEGGTAVIDPNDNKHITFNSKKLSFVGNSTSLDYTVFNNSSQYDANVNIEFNAVNVVDGVDYSDYYSLTFTGFDPTTSEHTTYMPGKTSKEGSITITLEQPLLKEVQIEFTLTLVPSAVERESIAIDYDYHMMFRGKSMGTRVKTGFDNGTNTSGIWSVYTDEVDGGSSYIRWPIENVDLSDPNSVRELIDYCDGICGTAVLDKVHGPEYDYNGYVVIEFPIAGVSLDTNEFEAVDASNIDGICISYISHASPVIELGLGDVDATIGYANPFHSLAKSYNGAEKILLWNSFKQPTWYKGAVKINGEEAATQLVSIRFKVQNTPGEYYFNIHAIGSADGACPASF